MSHYYAAAAAAGGFTLREQNISTTGEDSVYMVDSATGYATNFTPAASYTITKAAFTMWKAGGTTPDGNLRVSIYANVSNLVNGASLGTSSTRPASDVVATTAAGTELEFTGLSVAVTNGTSYKIAIERVSQTTGEMGVLWSAVTGDIDLLDSSVWQNYLDTNSRLKFKTWSTP